MSKAEMSFDEEGLLKEPCISCNKARVDNLFYEWYCDEKKCIRKKANEKRDKNDKRRKEPNES